MVRKKFCRKTSPFFCRNGDGSWNLNPQKITNPGNETDSLFGSAIAVDERRLVISAKGLDKVFLYELNGPELDVWVLRHTLISKRAVKEDYKSNFGESIALKGEAIAVGAPYTLIGDLEPKTKAGACFLFRYNNATGKWSEVAAFRASDMYRRDNFGISVAMDEKEVFVGSLNDIKDFRSGAVYVYDAKPSSTSCAYHLRLSKLLFAVFGALTMLTTAHG